MAPVGRLVLARHYSMMAASIFPVIEIDAQRKWISSLGRDVS